MSTSQAELKRIVDENEKKLQTLWSDFSESQEWTELNQKQLDLEKTLSEIKEKKRKLESQIREQREGEIAAVKSDRDHAFSILKTKEMGLNPKDYNEDLQKMFKAFYAGSTWDQEKRLFWVSEDGKFAIFKKRAYQAYINRGQTSYSEAFWCLFVINSECREYNGSSTSRLEMGSKYCIWKAEGGRWNKDRMKEVEQAIKDYKIRNKV